MNLHQAEFIAGELIALTVAGYALVGILRQHKRQEPPPDWPEHGETTEYSSTTDD